MFFQAVEYHCDNLLERLHFLTLHFVALFLLNVLSGSNCCLSVLETVSIHVPARNMLTSPSSHAHAATAHHLNMFRRQMKFVNIRIFLVTQV
jgi:hypothetical protein